MFLLYKPIDKPCEHNFNKSGRGPLGNATKALGILVSDKKILSCFYYTNLLIYHASITLTKVVEGH